jgi:molecular chaperone DnaK
MAQRLYANQQPGAGGGPSAEQPQSGGDDNVVDAEFEEVKDDDKRKGS